MALPSWFAGMTNAASFADPTKNGGLPTLGDAMQGIGSSMKNHYLYGQGQAPAAGQPQPVPMSAFAPAPAAPNFNPRAPLDVPSWAGGQAPWGSLANPKLQTAPGPTGAASSGGAASIPLAEILRLF